MEEPDGPAVGRPDETWEASQHESSPARGAASLTVTPSTVIQCPGGVGVISATSDLVRIAASYHSFCRRNDGIAACVCSVIRRDERLVDHCCNRVEGYEDRGPHWVGTSRHPTGATCLSGQRRAVTRSACPAGTVVVFDEDRIPATSPAHPALEPSRRTHRANIRCQWRRQRGRVSRSLRRPAEITPCRGSCMATCAVRAPLRRTVVAGDIRRTVEVGLTE